MRSQGGTGDVALGNLPSSEYTSAAPFAVPKGAPHAHSDDCDQPLPAGYQPAHPGPDGLGLRPQLRVTPAQSQHRISSPEARTARLPAADLGQMSRPAATPGCQSAPVPPRRYSRPSRGWPEAAERQSV